MPTDPEPGAPKQVWYACNGSNLNYERLLCYIKGGTAMGRSGANEGCRDQRPPSLLRWAEPINRHKRAKTLTNEAAEHPEH
jgi:hypothetical protein